MTVEVHVDGRIELGKLHEFVDAVEPYKEYAKSHGYAVPDVLFGLSGEMNSIRLVYRFADATEYEQQEVRTMRDKDYGEIASRMAFREGTLAYSIYRQI